MKLVRAISFRKFFKLKIHFGGCIEGRVMPFPITFHYTCIRLPLKSATVHFAKRLRTKAHSLHPHLRPTNHINSDSHVHPNPPGGDNITNRRPSLAPRPSHPASHASRPRKHALLHERAVLAEHPRHALHRHRAECALLAPRRAAPRSRGRLSHPPAAPLQNPLAHPARAFAGP